MNICSRTLLFALGLLLPGCIKYYELSKTEFPQGKVVKDQTQIAHQYMRSVKIYDEFRTVALFDLLWLSPEVRTYFTNRFCAKRGKDNETRKAIENRQLEETNHWIGFYVLSDIRTREHTSLNEKNAAWTFYLTINNTIKLEPLSIKETELEPEYQALFGSKFNSFKSVYLVKFSAYGLDGKPYITTTKPALSLSICGTHREGKAEWNIGTTHQTMVMNHEDFYWG
ncbi:hypothetical protein FJ364_01345 [Candidatus Dependentiae bacterium]|nr:hypothetical protein [Candidatus Dependentiae bacterium]